jgi:S-adenosyl-L-methionine methyltransferase
MKDKHAGQAPGISRLERLLFRIDAQHKSLGWAFDEIEGLPGLVVELGLGHGRTYDHMRRHLPDRDIFVFDREIDCFADCRPDDAHLVLGQLADTLPAARARFGGKAILVNSDVGTYDDGYNIAVAELVSQHLPPLLARGALVLSDLPLRLTGTQTVAPPAGARDDRFFIYRAAG